MRRSIAQEIYETLRDRVLSGDLPPGGRLLERELQQEFSSSSSPVREAVRLLCASGFAEVTFNKGAVVVDYNDIDRRMQFYEIRLALERYCIGRIAAAGDTQKIAAIAAAAGEMEALAGRDNPEAAEVLARDENFHLKLIESADNAEMLNIYRSSSLFVRSSLGKCSPIKPRIAVTLSEHRRIVEAIEKNDLTGIDQLLHAHLMVREVAVLP